MPRRLPAGRRPVRRRRRAHRRAHGDRPAEGRPHREDRAGRVGRGEGDRGPDLRLPGRGALRRGVRAPAGPEEAARCAGSARRSTTSTADVRRRPQRDPWRPDGSAPSGSVLSVVVRGEAVDVRTGHRAGRAPWSSSPVVVATVVATVVTGSLWSRTAGPSAPWSSADRPRWCRSPSACRGRPARSPRAPPRPPPPRRPATAARRRRRIPRLGRDAGARRDRRDRQHRVAPPSCARRGWRRRRQLRRPTAATGAVAASGASAMAREPVADAPPP